MKKTILLALIFFAPIIVYCQTWIKSSPLGPPVDSSRLFITNYNGASIQPQSNTLLQLLSSGINGRISFDTYFTGTVSGSAYTGRRARGTAVSPAAPQLDDILVVLNGSGYGVDSFPLVSSGSVAIRAENTFTNTSKPTYIDFLTAPTGSVLNVSRMKIKSDGVINIAGLNATGFVQTNSSGDLSTAALTSLNITTALGYTPQQPITIGTTAQYLRGDLSLATFPTTTASFSSSTNKNFVTDAQLTILGNTSGSNSGDNAVNSLYSGLVSNANHTGDATGSTVLTLATVNGNVGTFSNATITVNAKGLITAASSGTSTGQTFQQVLAVSYMKL